MLEIKNLHVYVDGKHIVKGVDLDVKPGEVHVVMGPNGSGKSSLAYALMGHPNYRIKNKKAKSKNSNPAGSKIVLDGKDITDESPDERARTGLFLAFQHPVGIPGVSVANFLRVAKQSLTGDVKKEESKAEEMKNVAEFNKILQDKAEMLGIEQDFLKRSLNESFSGGEKKKIEMLQLMVLEPKYGVIDEIDTGLDVDALKLVASGIKKIEEENKTGVLLITHYQRILQHLRPDFVHVMKGGKIVHTGSHEVAAKIEKKGYQSFN